MTAAPTLTHGLWEAPDGYEQPAPVVLVSSRAGAPAPMLPSVRRLITAATGAGWDVSHTYAVAAISETRLKTGDRVGEVRKPAHELESVAVRLRRGGARAWAVWSRESGKGWQFAGAYIGMRPVGLRELMTEVTA